jgi:CRISPR-associated protein Cas1
MTDGILDLSDRPARLNVANTLLVVNFEGEEAKRIPLEELAVVIAAHPQISYTHRVLSGLAAVGAVFVTCDEKRRPVSMLLPLVTHTLQTERFAAQASLPLPKKKRIWQEIVRAKILAQGRVLEERTGSGQGLKHLARRVGSGDPQNLEAQGARIYWKALFGEFEFRRHAEGDGLNACLDYGYAVLRGMMARALCGAGLNPTLGLHHHNRYNPFCLADDLMEPFRPIVDRAAAVLRDGRGESLELDKEAKKALLESLLGRFEAREEWRTLFDWLALTAFSLAGVILGESKKLEIPRL